MRLIIKTGLIVSLAVLVALGGIFAVAGTVLLDDFRALEDAGADTDMARVLQAFETDKVELEGTAREVVQIFPLVLGDALAAQNGTTGTGTTANAANGTAGNDTAGTTGSGGDEQEDTAEQLGISVFEGNDLDLFAMRVPGMGFFAIKYDRVDRSFGNLSEAVNASLAGSPLWTDRDPYETVSGIVDTADGPYLLAAHPVLLPGGILPDGSALAVGRLLDDAFFAALGQETKEDVSIRAWTEADAAVLGSTGATHVDRHGNTMTLSARLDDASGAPAYVVQVEQTRDTYMKGIQSIQFFLIASTGISLILVALVLVVLRATVTGRVRRLRAHMRALRENGHQGDPGQAPPMGRARDEVSDLADEFQSLMTQLGRHERELHRSNEDLQRFASVVSHDLRSPLSTFRMNLHLMRARAAADHDEEALRRIERMEHSVARMDDRIQSILDYSRAQDTDRSLAPLDLEEVRENVLSDLAGEINRTGARIQVGPLPTVLGDKAQMEQVFQNLLQNAIKFHREGEPPRIRVWAERDGKKWRIHVEDRGIGFNNADKEEMLRPFGKIHDSGGHGIGLATCDRIMQRHGGRLGMVGVPGKGARFTLELQAAEQGPSTQETRSVEENAPRQGPPRPKTTGPPRPPEGSEQPAPTTSQERPEAPPAPRLEEVEIHEDGPRRPRAATRPARPDEVQGHAKNIWKAATDSGAVHAGDLIHRELQQGRGRPTPPGPDGRPTPRPPDPRFPGPDPQAPRPSRPRRMRPSPEKDRKKGMPREGGMPGDKGEIQAWDPDT